MEETGEDEEVACGSDGSEACQRRRNIRREEEDGASRGRWRSKEKVEREAGWEGSYQKVGGTDARGANVEGVCERGAGGRGQ